MQIPEGMDGPMKHETSARCRANRSVKHSRDGVLLLKLNFFHNC